MLTLSRDVLLLVTAGVVLVALAILIRLVQLAMRVLSTLGSGKDWWM